MSLSASEWKMLMNAIHDMNKMQKEAKENKSKNTKPNLQKLSQAKRDSHYPWLKGIAHSKLTSQVRKSAGL